MKIQTEGLVIREQTIGESDRLITMLTKDEGVVRAFARRAKSLKDSKQSGTALLCYSRFNLYKGRDKYVVNDAFPIDTFFGLRGDIAGLALAQYFCDLAFELVPSGIDAGESLRLVLNALSFLSGGGKDPKILKPIVELRMLSVSGYMPDLVCCRVCGAYEADPMLFFADEGSIRCERCSAGSAKNTVALSPAALKAMRHIIYSDFERIFSFSLTSGALHQLSAASEAYTVSTLQKRPKTLDFYRSLA